MCSGSLWSGSPGHVLSRLRPSSPPPIWSSAGVSLPVGCEESADIVTVPSGDRRAHVEVRCGELDTKRRVRLRIFTQDGRRFDHWIDRSYWRPQEVVWAPDSSAFVVNGSESVHAGNEFMLYDWRRGRVTPTHLTATAQRDMVSLFPPCWADGLTDADCRVIVKNPEFNMSVIAWTSDAKAVVVFAEVPCSSSFGGIMCQVMGYELEVPSGRILARMNARELKRRYQAQMAWPMRFPEEPLYRRR